MEVYAKVTIAGKSKYTEINLVNKTNPERNTTICFIVSEEDIIREDVPAVIKLFCQRSLSHDKYVGELNLTLRPFCIGECHFSSNRFGTSKFSHELGDKVLILVSDSSLLSEDSNA
ncbi:unnamed protein product [Withania somnifera]